MLFEQLIDSSCSGPQATLHGGITGGIVRDVTKVGSTIYAVGTWNAGTRIDGVVWTLDGVNPPQRTGLPDFCTTGDASS